MRQPVVAAPRSARRRPRVQRHRLRDLDVALAAASAARRPAGEQRLRDGQRRCRRRARGSPCGRSRSPGCRCPGRPPPPARAPWCGSATPSCCEDGAAPGPRVEDGVLGPHVHAPASPAGRCARSARRSSSGAGGTSRVPRSPVCRPTPVERDSRRGASVCCRRALMAAVLVAGATRRRRLLQGARTRAASSSFVSPEELRQPLDEHAHRASSAPCGGRRVARDDLLRLHDFGHAALRPPTMAPFADAEVAGDARLAAERDVVLELGASRRCRTCATTMQWRPMFDVVADLHQVVDLGAVADRGCCRWSRGRCRCWRRSRRRRRSPRCRPAGPCGSVPLVEGEAEAVRADHRAGVERCSARRSRTPRAPRPAGRGTSSAPTSARAPDVAAGHHDRPRAEHGARLDHAVRPDRDARRRARRPARSPPSGAPRPAGAVAPGGRCAPPAGRPGRDVHLERAAGWSSHCAASAKITAEARVSARYGS